MFWHWKVTERHGFFTRIGDEVLETGSSLIWPWMFCVVPYSSWNNQLRIRTLWIPLIFFYRPQRSCGKVMFLHLSVLRGVWADTPLGRYTHLWADPPGQTPPGQTSPPVQCMLGYGQQAGGTHPTGIQSCYIILSVQEPNAEGKYRTYQYRHVAQNTRDVVLHLNNILWRPIRIFPLPQQLPSSLPL